MAVLSGLLLKFSDSCLETWTHFDVVQQGSLAKFVQADRDRVAICMTISLSILGTAQLLIGDPAGSRGVIDIPKFGGDNPNPFQYNIDDDLGLTTEPFWLSANSEDRGVFIVEVKCRNR